MLPKSGAALLALVACALLATMSSAQDPDVQWFWIMADSKNNSAVCPGRCLAVNDTGGDYKNKPVGFVACKTVSSDSSSSSSSYVTSNGNQQWLRDDDDGKDAVVIQINATGGSDSQTPPQLLCLQPDPTKGNRSLVVTTCTGRRNQQWIVAKDTIASAAFKPPRFLAMSYRLARFLDPTDSTTAWREATIVAAPNRSLTTTFSMVDGTLDPPQLQLPAADNDPPESRNFIRNGGFEQSSSDFSPLMSNLSLSLNDIFGLCDWQIMKVEANLQGNLTPSVAPPEGDRSLYLKDGIVKQTVATSAGAFYTLSFKVHVATPSSDDSTSSSGTESDNCKGSDSFSVNPYPSSDVHMTVAVGNGSWSTKHVSFQSLADKLDLSLKGCATCGCFVDEINLMMVVEKVPFPPPPPMPSPPLPPGRYQPPPEDNQEPFGGRWPGSDRLSNWAVVGLVVGAAALFFVIGAVFFGVVCVKEKKERETEMTRRPPEWSIQTTTPAQSERGRRSGMNSQSQSQPDGSNPAASAPQPPSPRSSSSVGATKYTTSQSSTKTHSGSGL